MQLAVRYDKAEPAGHFATCAVAARAVVGLLVEAGVRGGEWQAAVDRWRDGRIRKLVRRARGVRWADVQSLPGVTVEQGRAAARAFLPGPVRPLPSELAKLQVAGTDLPLEDPADGPEDPDPTEVLIGLNPHITMTTGKAAAQSGHAAQLAWEAMTEPECARWAEAGHPILVATIPAVVWAREPGRIRVVDAGFTELPGPTETARAWWG